MKIDLVLLTLHVAANLVWVGSLLAVVVAAVASGGTPKQRGQTARSIYVRLAVPGFVGSFALGLARLGLDWNYYMVSTHFMHAKLLLALIAIVAHHVVGARVRALAGERVVSAPTLMAAGLVFGLAAFGAMVLAIAQPF